MKKFMCHSTYLGDQSVDADANVHLEANAEAWSFQHCLGRGKEFLHSYRRDWDRRAYPKTNWTATTLFEAFEKNNNQWLHDEEQQKKARWRCCDRRWPPQNSFDLSRYLCIITCFHANSLFLVVYFSWLSWKSSRPNLRQEKLCY